MAIMKKVINFNNLAKKVEKYSLMMEFALIRSNGEYFIDYNVIAKDRIINHISVSISQQEYDDFINGKINQIVKRK